MPLKLTKRQKKKIKFKKVMQKFLGIKPVKPSGKIVPARKRRRIASAKASAKKKSKKS